jgi:hypothetical protein
MTVYNPAKLLEDWHGKPMTLHTKLSYIKSGLRVLGYGALLGSSMAAAVVILVVSELIGIAEEAWPGAYKGTGID